MTAPAAGSALGPVIIDEVDPDAMIALSVILGDPNPLHLDPAAVRAAGLGDRVINQGPSNFGYVLSMLRDTVRDSAGGGFEIEEFRVRLLANVFGGDRVTAAGIVTESAADGLDCQVWLDVEGARRAIDGTARLRRTIDGRTPPPGDTADSSIPAGSTVFTPDEQDRLEAILATGRTSGAEVGDAAHPVWAMIGAMRGVGVSVDELFLLLDCPMADGPMLGECSLSFWRPLLVGTRYRVDAAILGVTRKQGGKLGAFDLARTGFRLSDDRGPVCDVGMTFVLPRRAELTATETGATR